MIPRYNRAPTITLDTPVVVGYTLVNAAQKGLAYEPPWGLRSGLKPFLVLK